MRWLLPLALLSAACGGAPDPRPNVLLVTLDTTRADRLGCYGYPRETSPVIDALAAEGVRFEQALSSSAVTPVAHASLFTGLFPDRHGLRVFAGESPDRLGAEPPVLAEAFRAGGWSTGAFVSAFTASQQFGLDRGFEVFDADFEGSREGGATGAMRRARGLQWLDQPAVSVQRRADATTDRALAWLRDRDGPFFLWVHYFDPHDPWLVPPADVLSDFGVSPGDPDPKLVHYDPEVFFMDRELGRLVAALREDGRLAHTLVALVSDHGQGLGDHGWLLHGVLYQEQLRAPLVLRGPGLPAGLTVPAFVRTVDLFPTLLELAGLPPSPDVQGRSLLPLVRGEADEPRVGYAEALNTLEPIPPALPESQRDLLFAVVDWPWKLIHHGEQPERSELYQLERDPGELRNRLAERPDVHTRLLDRLLRSGALEIRGQDGGPLAPDTLEKLRALGYVN
jgi:arylsulfatase A-like enzyme